MKKRGVVDGIWIGTSAIYMLGREGSNRKNHVLRPGESVWLTVAERTDAPGLRRRTTLSFARDA